MPFSFQSMCNPRSCIQFDAMALIIVNRQRKQPISGLPRKACGNHGIKAARYKDNRGSAGGCT